KDGHNWRKKKDGKTVKEAHERLKSGSIDVLHCYYAHGEDNENFQRRSYWLLEEDRSNIVLVHYLEVKGNRTNTNRVREATRNSLGSEENISTSEVGSSTSSKFRTYNYPVASQTTDNSTQASEYADAESAYSHQSTSRYGSILNSQPSVAAISDDPLSMPYYPVSSSNDYDGKLQAYPDMSFVSLMQGNTNGTNLDIGLTNASESYSAGSQSASYQPTQPHDTSMRQLMPGGFDKMQEFRGNPGWQLHGGTEFDERSLSLLASKTARTSQYDAAAAVCIQNKFRSWKGRKDFLIMRQRIVKIQAHVRGHQVRKNYKKIIWSVGILDKVILRWRRKGSGLRGFKPEGVEAKEEDDDFFKQGRKQTEQRLQKALARVKSMAQYPEARDQYSRLLNVVNDVQQS
ncbi:hypothetical protein M8C21_014805, partial [Ambrosia artemisiifolia]